jgi:hypothetical protein
MQLCRTIYYSIVPWLLNVFRVILSLIIRSIQTVITASGLLTFVVAGRQRKYFCLCMYKIPPPPPAITS